MNFNVRHHMKGERKNSNSRPLRQLTVIVGTKFLLLAAVPTRVVGLAVPTITVGTTVPTIITGTYIFLFGVVQTTLVGTVLS